MRRTTRVPLSIAGLAGLLVFAAGFAPSSESSIDDAELVLRFQRVFASGELPEHDRSSAAGPEKCAMSLVRELEERRDVLPAHIVQKLDGYLAPPRLFAAQHFVTEHFDLAYETSGEHAVSAVDVDPANGVPDYVESIGAFAEISYAYHVGAMGFAAPVPQGQRVAIEFREMEAYGYTERIGAAPRIVLHRSFEGFPANRDPEGSARGAAKVTVAHELRHACQLAMSGWTEGKWLEADATFAEDRVFDAVDDYLHYLGSGSPVSDPRAWAWVGPGYEDCLWGHLLADEHGESIVRELFVRRASNPMEPVLRSYDVTLRSRGSSLAAMASKLAVWSHFCGANSSGRPEGFEEADSYPTPPVHHLVTGVPANVTGASPGLGTYTVMAVSPSSAGRPQIFVSGASTRPFAVHAISLDRQGARRVFRIAAASGRSDVAELPVEWSELISLTTCVTVLDASAIDAPSTVMFDDDLSVGASDLASGPRLELLPNRPNPFRDVTSIVFALPVPGRASLSVYDATGRLVRTLASRETLAAGRHEVTWNGDDASGSRVAPGVYAVRLESVHGTASRKIHLLR